MNEGGEKTIDRRIDNGHKDRTGTGKGVRRCERMNTRSMKRWRMKE